MLSLTLYANEGRLQNQNRRKTERGWASVSEGSSSGFGGSHWGSTQDLLS